MLNNKNTHLKQITNFLHHPCHYFGLQIHRGNVNNAFKNKIRNQKGFKTKILFARTKKHIVVQWTCFNYFF